MLVKNDFLSHWKVKLLCKRLGDGPALRALISLWAYCEQRRAWEFRLSPLELAGVCDYGGNPEELFQLLRDLRLIMAAEDGYFQVNGWGEMNSALVHKWPGRRLGEQEYWHPRGMIENGAIPKAKAQPIAQPIPKAKAKPIPQAIGLDRIGLDRKDPLTPKGDGVGEAAASRSTDQTSDLFAQSDTDSETQTFPAKKRKGGGRASGSIELPESWSDARRGIVGEWFSHRLALGKHITTAQFAELCLETASLSDAQFRACVDDAITKRQTQLQPHKFAGSERDMFGPPVDLIERIYAVYPRREAKPNAVRAIQKALRKTGIEPQRLLHLTELYAAKVAFWPKAVRYGEDGRDKVPLPATWFNQHRFNDDPANWELQPTPRSQKKEGGAASVLDEPQFIAAPAAPDGWQDAWDAIYPFPAPPSWLDVPAANASEVLAYLRNA